MAKAKKVTVEAQDNEQEIMPIQTKHLAAKFGIKPTTLRRILRTMPEYNDGLHTNYRWAEDDARIDAIAQKLQEIEEEKQARTVAARAAMEARLAKMQVQARVDATMLKA